MSDDNRNHPPVFYPMRLSPREQMQFVFIQQCGLFVNYVDEDLKTENYEGMRAAILSNLDREVFNQTFVHFHFKPEELRAMRLLRKTISEVELPLSLEDKNSLRNKIDALEALLSRPYSSPTLH